MLAEQFGNIMDILHINQNISKEEAKVCNPQALAICSYKFQEKEGANRRSTRSKSHQKYGEEEFFNMTYLSNLLSHPQKNKLIEL